MVQMLKVKVTRYKHVCDRTFHVYELQMLTTPNCCIADVCKRAWWYLMGILTAKTARR